MSVRLGNLANLKLYIDLFIDISGPRLCATLIMNKNGLLFPMTMTLRKGLELCLAYKNKKMT